MFFWNYFEKLGHIIACFFDTSLLIFTSIDIFNVYFVSSMAGTDSSNRVRKVFDFVADVGSRRQARPRQRWADQVTENIAMLAIRNWR